MGGEASKEESLSPAVADWSTRAKSILNTYYIGFAGKQFDEYNPQTDIKLLRTKICFSLYGPPSSSTDKIEDAYTSAQRDAAQKLCDIILEVYKKSGSAKLAVGFIFIFCKEGDKNEFSLPLFRVYTSSTTVKYIDTQSRIYDNWNDWKQNNTLPMLRYCYPKDGYFTCQSGSYKFDASKEVVVEYGDSPACALSARTGRALDVGATIGALGAGIIGIIALLTPVGFIAGSIIYTGSLIGGGSAVWGLGRAINRLVDKGNHGESLTDLESWMLWTSIAATPLTFISALSNARLAVGASQGRIFSTSTRIFATVLNCTTLGVDGVMMTFGLANLIEKAKNKQLKPLDVLQFSISVFFFTHTLVQPITASKIIKNAQAQHIDAIGASINDIEAKAAFDKFLNENRGDIKADSNVIRTLNRIDNAETFFKANVDASSMKIGGRKGKTILITDANNRTNRINPNRIFYASRQQGAVKIPNKVLRKTQECLGVRDLADFKLNGENIFANMSDRQKGRLGKVFGGAAGYQNEIVFAAKGIAEAMGVNDANNFMNIVEIVAAEAAGKSGRSLNQHLSHLNSNKAQFIANIQSDQAKAIKIAKQSGLPFSEPLTAVYHYRKHGSDFPSKIMGNSIEFYLGNVPSKLITDAHLIEQCTFNDGTIQKIYSKPNDSFAVVTETADKRTISTMFKKQGTWQNYLGLLKDRHENATEIPPINDAAARLATSLGFPSINVFLCTGESRMPLSGMKEMDEDDHNIIANILASFADDNNNNA